MRRKDRKTSVHQEHGCLATKKVTSTLNSLHKIQEGSLSHSVLAQLPMLPALTVEMTCPVDLIIIF